MTGAQGSRGPKPFDSDDKAVAAMLKKFRISNDMSQEQFARRMGIKTQAYWQIENNIQRIPAGHLVKLARSLKVPVSTFFPKDVQ